VIPVSSNQNASPSTIRLEDLASTGVFYSIADYNAAYVSKSLTPTAVIEALLPIICRDVPKPTVHSTAFLQTNIDSLKKAAEASTLRHKEGKPLSVLDGVPIAIKDEVDLADYKKTLGTKRDYTDKGNRTSWAVQKWIDQGAIVIGKLTMHELGLGE